MELMVGVAIMAILSAIAYPLYESQSRKGKRPDGMVLLEQVAQGEQRHFSHMGTFTSTVTDLTGIKSATSPGGHYLITVESGATGSIASSFVVKATPLGAQLKDVCETFTLSDLGIRGATATGVSDSNAARIMCWGK